MPEKPLTYRKTWQMRKNFVGRACKLHFEVSPLKIVRASKQYLYDDNGCEYLDCISNVSHVGHCHPHVVHAGQEQMGKLVTSAGFLDDKMVEYAKRIIETLPDQLCVCFFLNSGSEANDLALRLARSYTKNEDFIVLDHAYHGNIGSLLDLSPSKWKKVGQTKKEWVHVVDCPDMYRGKHKDDANPSLKYAQQVHTAIKKAKEKGRNIAGFLSEPLMSICGVINPPRNYLKLVYSFVRSSGGICIADEIQVGLGRCGESFWSFQMHDVVPDILTVGKPLGNGHPMAMVVTTKEIADSIGEFNSTFGGNPVACAVGMAVLDVIHNEKLMSSARNVGKCLMDGMRAIAPNHPMLGDIRGTGMVIGIEIVTDKESKKPSKEGAEILAYKLKEQKIIIANEGPDKNVMTLLPPMCFTCDNARRVVQAFDLALADIEKGAGNKPLAQSEDTKMNVPLNILSGLGSSTGLGILDDPENDGESDSKRPRYDEMD
ncbi:5-phosphohydroxy-L-lysine phospho-lyase-like isoform X2 [Saccostrea cucullata]|uniref:5-phosphohydroxy-L-lysine phospho-lyase-like isoform X2 n=1 Tax=Saccostrea cuccullata TaxID=36930 RepID=UPI002ED3E368